MGTTNTQMTAQDVRRKKQHKFSSAEKIRIVVAGLRDERSIAELCRREGINQNLYTHGARVFWKEATTAGRHIMRKIRMLH